MRSASSSYAGGRPLRQQMPSQPVLRADYLLGRHEIESWDLNVGRAGSVVVTIGD
jgi:hypothetical protein